MLACRHQTKWSMVTWADLCLLYMLYEIYKILATNYKSTRPSVQAYNMLLYLQDLGKQTWAYHVKELLCRNDFGDVWLQQNVGHLNRVVSVFKQTAGSVPARLEC